MSSFNGFRARILDTLQRIHPGLPFRRPPEIGFDGLAMLLLANFIIAASGGLTLVIWFGKVYRVARSAPSSTSHGGCRLVLGERLRGGAPSEAFAERLARALALGGPGRILVAGGPPDAVLSEARAGREWLIAHGASPDEIDMEETSRNTLENLVQVREKIGSTDGEGLVIISSRYHLARCATLARGLGLKFNTCASEANLRLNAYNFRKMIVEAYFLNWYFVGKTWATFTNNRKMLSRIR